MSIDFTQHKKITAQIAGLLDTLQQHEHNVRLQSEVDSFWYLQKLEELTLLQQQLDEVTVRMKTLRMMLFTESRKTYHKLKADERKIRKICRAETHLVMA